MHATKNIISNKCPCVVLVSGGLDSAVVLALAIRDGFEPHCLTIKYGQRHAIEIDSARRVCSQYDFVAVHKILDLDLSMFGGSSLTVADSNIPKFSNPGKTNVIPSTYVPARNMVFLSLATSWAEAIFAKDLFIGVSSVDYSGYPDCRPRFIESFEKTANLGTRAADSGSSFVIHSPLINLSKGQTIRLGFDLGVDFSRTWSCYDPDAENRPCGACDSCLLRAKGFLEAGLSDPLLLRS